MERVRAHKREPSPEARSDDISGILILRHLMSEVIQASRGCRLEHLTARLEEALRGVQPQPFQAMRKRKPKSFPTSRRRV
ncbi:MAG TPA: hypothetical protein VNM14_24900 [Planctomycetota bacterium]|nr:hypothetical protein [Planctomycetota bacterium]